MEESNKLQNGAKDDGQGVEQRKNESKYYRLSISRRMYELIDIVPMSDGELLSELAALIDQIETESPLDVKLGAIIEAVGICDMIREHLTNSYQEGLADTDATKGIEICDQLIDNFMVPINKRFNDETKKEEQS